MSENKLSNELDLGSIRKSPNEYHVVFSNGDSRPLQQVIEVKDVADIYGEVHDVVLCSWVYNGIQRHEVFNKFGNVFGMPLQRFPPCDKLIKKPDLFS